MRYLFCLVWQKIERERERFGLLCCDDGGEEKKVGGDQMWKWKKMNGTHCDCE